jgi:hypothetical protein
MALYDSNIDSSDNPHIHNNTSIIPIPLFYQVIVIDLIFQKLQELLSDTNIGMNNLLNVSAKHFQDLKKAKFYWKFNRKYSLIYYDSLQFRERISLLTKTKRQLSLICSRPDIVDVTVLNDVHALDLSHCTHLVDVSTLGNVHELKLYCCTSIRDISRLGNVHTLDLSHCTGIFEYIHISPLYAHR